MGKRVCTATSRALGFREFRPPVPLYYCPQQLLCRIMVEAHQMAGCFPGQWPQSSPQLDALGEAILREWRAFCTALF